MAAKHPDARWRGSSPALTHLALEQARMLDAAASVVRPGGWLVYATCSLESEENEEQVTAFLDRRPAFRRDPPTGFPAELLSAAGDLALLPQRHGMDGCVRGEAPESAGVRLTRPPGARPARPYFSTIAGRRLVRQSLVVVAAFVAGYLATVFWLFPAPLQPKDRPLPRLLDLGPSEAKVRVESEGFRFVIQDRQPDPTVPRGAVIWQDPPPGVIAPPTR